MHLSMEEWRQAMRAVSLCCSSYMSQSSFLRLAANSPEMLAPMWIEDPETDTQGFACVIEDTIWIVMQGSHGKKDWRRNAQCFPSGGIHRKWKANAKSVYLTVRAYCRKYHGLPVVCTGHSLGAANSLILAYWLARDGYTVDHVGFGGPRPFASWMAGKVELAIRRIFRWVNDRDGVPAVPPISFGYVHVGALRLILPTGKLSDKPSDLLRNRASGIAKAITGRGVEVASDHSVEFYYSAVKASKPTA